MCEKNEFFQDLRHSEWWGLIFWLFG